MRSSRSSRVLPIARSIDLLPTSEHRFKPTPRRRATLLRPYRNVSRRDRLSRSQWPFHNSGWAAARTFAVVYTILDSSRSPSASSQLWKHPLQPIQPGHL